MRLYIPSLSGMAIASVFATVAVPFAFSQNPSVPGPAGQTALKGDAAVAAEASKGVPPRLSPGDYQTHAQMGAYTLAAEFAGHGVPTPDGTFTTEDFLVAEVAFFGPAGAKIALTPGNFSIIINGKKKTPLPAQPYALVFHSLKDPDYIAPELEEAKKNGGSGNGISTGGAAGQSTEGNLPPVVHIPIGIERAMEEKVRKAALPEGERPLPVAGLIFFDHHGKTSSIQMIYSGPAGKATLTLQ